VLYERWRLALRSRPTGGGSKPPHAALAEDRRGERWGKGVQEASGRDWEDDHCWSIETLSDDIKTGVWCVLRDEPGGCPLIGQVVSGVEVAW